MIDVSDFTHETSDADNGVVLDRPLPDAQRLSAGSEGLDGIIEDGAIRCPSSGKIYMPTEKGRGSR